MTQRLYLDVASALRAGYSTAFDNFSWPISQQTYDSIAGSFVDFLEATVVGTTHNESEKFDLALSIVPIANECFFFVGSHMIMDACERSGQGYEFSRNGLYYPAIAEYRSGRTKSVSDALLQMQTNPPRGFAGKFIRPQRKRLQRYQLGLRSWLKHPRVYQMTGNTLMNEWTKPEYASLRSLASTTGWGHERIGRRQSFDQLSDHITQNFVRIVGDHGFCTDELLHEYIRRISAIHLAIARHWREKNHERYFNTHDSVLLTGTAGGFESRLMSHVFQRNGLMVIRFSHGGERGLIDDPRWHYTEIMFTDFYMVHGRTEASQVQDAVNRKTSSLTSENLQVVGAGSRFHSQLRSRHDTPVSSGQIRNVMVVPTSLKSEVRPAFVSTGEEITYFEWHLRLLKSLRAADFNVISKRHPKGFLASTTLFDGYAHEEITRGMFTEQMDRADAFVFDFAGSAFMEALCTNKPVVLVEFPHRTMSAAGRKELGSVCTLVSAEYDESNRIVADFSEVVRGLGRPVDRQQRKNFLDNYLLEPSDNLSEFTKLIDRSI